MAKYGRPPKRGKNLGEKLGLNNEKTEKTAKSLGEKFGLALLALGIAVGTYFFTKGVLIPDIAIWAREILSLILSLLVLSGFSAVSKGDNRIGTSVVIFLFAIFIWQMANGYSDHDFSSDETVRKYSSEVSVRTLYPRDEPYVFHLSEVGDETNWFKFPEGGDFSYSISSPDFGYKLIFSDGDKFKGDPNLRIPNKIHPRFKFRSLGTNQIISITIKGG